MSTATSMSWDEIDEETRKDLDLQYLEELSSWDEPGLTDQGIRAYLDYRHERPHAAITTFEEGQIRKMLHGMRDLSKIPDPVETEEHVDPLEVFGARWLHLTNTQTYVAVMVALTFAAILIFLLFLILT